jgi:hypothetical protein
MTLPNFIGIGVAKAGTTSISRYLAQHPQVYMCPIKATNFFGYEDARDWRWHEEGDPPLLRNFPVKTFEEYQGMFAGASTQLAIGEVSPQYFRCPTAARRIHERLPGVKLFASLRNPAERAFSGLLMRTRRGEAVAGFREELTPRAGHVKEGFYYARLKRYLDLFPREQVKVFLFDDFKQDPTGIVADLFGFLGVDPAFTVDTSVQHNPAAVPRVRLLNRLLYNATLARMARTFFPAAPALKPLLKRVRLLNLQRTPKLPPDLRAELIKLYREDILRLQELLGRDLSVWLEGA